MQQNQTSQQHFEPSPLEEAIRLSVDYITNKAQHFFSVVRSKQEDGVLWFAFSYKEETIGNAIRNKKVLSADEVAKNGTLAVKKTAFLPVSAIVTTDSKPLLDMLARCDKRQQFVAWFTLEPTVYGFNGEEKGRTTSGSSGSTPQVSKVIIVDTMYMQQGMHHSSSSAIAARPSASAGVSSSMPTRYATPGRAGIMSSRQQQQEQQQYQNYSNNNNNNNSHQLEDLKRDMQSTASQLQQQQREYQATPHRTLSGMNNNRQSSSVSLSMNNNNSNNNSPTSRGGGGGNNNQSFNGYNNVSNNNMSTTTSHLAPDANYSHLLKVSLQISDSVSKLSGKLDDLTDRFNNFEKNISAEVVDIRKRVQKTEGGITEIKPKLQEVSDSTMHFGTKIAHLRQECQALFEGVSKRVQHVSDSVIAQNLGIGAGSSSSNNNNNNNTSQRFPPSTSGGNNNNTISPSSSGNYNPYPHHHHAHRSPSANNNARSSSAALQAVEEADKAINFDELMAKHSSSSGVFDQPSTISMSNNKKNNNAEREEDPSQTALDSFLSDTYERKPNFASRKAEIESREHAMKHAQEAVDEYKTLSRDVINYENEEQQRKDDHPISLTGVHRQKASLELARQHAADKSEAQAIASSYMTERNRALQNSTTTTTSSASKNNNNSNNSVSGGGVAVPLEHRSNEDNYGNDFEVSNASRMNLTSSNNKKSSSSLSDMISSMEQRLQM